MENATRRHWYNNGYNAGAKWPAHTPPNPPQEQVLELFVAAKDLRDAAFGLLQVIDADDGPDGPFVTLQSEANKVDAAFINISNWLKANVGSDGL